MPAASMGRPGQNRASRSVTPWSGRSGPAGAAVSVAIWHLLYQTKLISSINPNDIDFSGQDTTRGAAGSRRPPGRWPPGDPFHPDRTMPLPAVRAIVMEVRGPARSQIPALEARND